MSEPVLRYLEIYGHYFKSSEGGIEGRTLRGFSGDSVHEYIDKHIGISDYETTQWLKEVLGYTASAIEGDWDFWIDIDDYGQNLGDRENNEDGFWYEGKASAGFEEYLSHPQGRSFPYVEGRFRSAASVSASTDDPTTRRILMLLKLIGQAQDDDSLLLEVVRLWLVEEARDLRGIQLEQFSAADVGSLNLTGVRYDDKTTWPAGFDPAAAGAVSA